MSFLTGVKSFFTRLGKWALTAFAAAEASGLTDEIIKTALEWVKVAANMALDNAGKREFVVKILVEKGVPESVARLAIELAYQIFKRELEKTHA